ncbi:hypothetical protein [Myxococcus sp. Y35]|uniref:hypothetical protein n=1 Tax=Pseudomyxococcus flavus TaxID=3115648 RepID=UPI003CF51CAE
MDMDDVQWEVEEAIAQKLESIEVAAAAIAKLVEEDAVKAVWEGAEAIILNAGAEMTRALNREGRLGALKKKINSRATEVATGVRKALAKPKFWPHQSGHDFNAGVTGLMVRSSIDPQPPDEFVKLVNVPVSARVNEVLASFGYTHPMGPVKWSKVTVTRIEEYMSEVKRLRDLQSKLESHIQAKRHQELVDLWRKV